MTTDLTDTLDAALEQLRSGEPIPTILAHHPAQAEALLPLLNSATTLRAIGPVETPSQEALSSDRNDFLAQIALVQAQAVSPGLLVRLKEWIAHRIPQKTFQRKEQRRMSALLVKATLIISMAFGSAGGAAALAANSLPDSPLYPAKLAMEQTRLNATTDPAGQAELHMTLAGIRVQEMNRLALAGRVPGEPTLLRLQTHLNQALHAAAQLPDDEMLGFLTRARQTIQDQEQALKQVQARSAEPAQEPLRQARRLLSQARQDVEAGLQDPNNIRRRTTESRPSEAPSQPSVVPVPGGSSPDCPTGDCEPLGDQNQYGPQPNQPGPGGPGVNPDCPTGECEPVGDQNQYGPQPNQPGPGGPGVNPEPCTDCEPAGDQHQNGPQPEQPGPGEPGVNPEPCTDCEPEGDQHQNGPQPSDDNDEPSDSTPPDDQDSGGNEGGQDNGESGGGNDADGGSGGNGGNGGRK